MYVCAFACVCICVHVCARVRVRVCVRARVLDVFRIAFFECRLQRMRDLTQEDICAHRQTNRQKDRNTETHTHRNTDRPKVEGHTEDRRTDR